MTAVKICGITRLEDAQAAATHGATFIGFVLWPNSPRATTIETVRAIVRAMPKRVTPVGVFVNPTVDELNAAADAGIEMAQVHGDTAPVFAGARVAIIPAVHLAPEGDGVEPAVSDALVLLDAHDPVQHGGTGKTIDWARAATVARSRAIMLAGGLTPDNVRAAIQQVRPFAVDVSSGVESAPGIKDERLIQAFITTVKETK